MKKIFVLFIFFLLKFSSGHSQEQLYYSTENGSVRFKSEAQKEIINAESTRLKGILDITKKTFAFKVLIRSFEGFNSPLQQEHFNEKYLESDLYPEAFFSGKIIEEVDLSHDGDFNIRAKGKLTIHGINNERIIKCIINIKNGVVEVKSSFSIMLSDHNIKVPKIVHEKVATEILIEIRVTMKRTH